MLPPTEDLPTETTKGWSKSMSSIGVRASRFWHSHATSSETRNLVQSRKLRRSLEISTEQSSLCFLRLRLTVLMLIQFISICEEIASFTTKKKKLPEKSPGTSQNFWSIKMERSWSTGDHKQTQRALWTKSENFSEIDIIKRECISCEVSDETR